MGIYDREYYRDARGFSGWFSGEAPATRTIILLNVLIYVLQVFVPTLNLGEILAAHSDQIIGKFHIWQLLTAPFLHDEGDLLHIVFNMLMLYWVGREMEAVYGSREFVLLYLMAGIFSTAVWALVDYFGPMPSRSGMWGASGAVMAIVVLFTLFNPNREVLFMFVLPVKMWVLLVLFLGVDAISLLRQLTGGVVTGGNAAPTAYAAHLAGAAYGFAYKRWGLRWGRLFRPGTGRFPSLRRPSLRIVHPEATERLRPGPVRPIAPYSGTRPSATHLPTEEYLDARLDEVLAKIARDGRESLTEEDQRVLQEASRRARNRRSERLS